MQKLIVSNLGGRVYVVGAYGSMTVSFEFEGLISMCSRVFYTCFGLTINVIFSNNGVAPSVARTWPHENCVSM